MPSSGGVVGLACFFIASVSAFSAKVTLWLSLCAGLGALSESPSGGRHLGTYLWLKT